MAIKVVQVTMEMLIILVKIQYLQRIVNVPIFLKQSGDILKHISQVITQIMLINVGLVSMEQMKYITDVRIMVLGKVG